EIQKALGVNYAPLYESLKAKASDERVQTGAKAAAHGALATFSPAQNVGAPIAPVGANAMHIGDSIATGTAAAQYGAGWQSNPNVTAHVGDNPQAVLSQLKTVAARGQNAFAGRDIVLSTGTSNLQADGAWNRSAFDTSGVKTIGAQLDTLKVNGADMSRVRVLGVGPNAGGDYANSRLQSIASRYGAKFSSIPAGDYGAGGVHATPAGYSKMLGAPTSNAPAAPVDAASFLRGAEGFRTNAYWDVNHFRAGYGSDTVTHADGTVEPVTQNTVVTREDAERDLARRVNETQAGIQRTVGDQAWNGLAPGAKAALTSVAYNYGHLPDSVASAVGTGDVQKIAQAIASLPANPDRRRQEAEIALGHGGAFVANEPSIRAQSARQAQAGGEPALAPEQSSAVATQPVAPETLSAPSAPPKPPEETPEDKLMRLNEARSSAVASMIQSHPDWSDAELAKGERLIQAQFAMYATAVDEDKKARDARKLALANDVDGALSS